MQRSKAAVSLEVKRVITALCRLLVSVGLTSVPAPDIFRRAKFGEVTVEDQLWKLLLNICQITSDINLDKSEDSERRRQVAAGLWQAGYHASWMCEKEGRHPSSRDLLLALGWLLATGMPEKLMTRQVLQLDRTLLTPPSLTSQITAEVDCDSFRRLQWLVGSLKNQGRILLSMTEERARILHALLSPSQTSAVVSKPSSNKSVLKEECAVVQDLCELFQAYLDWKTVEKVFWTWMDSVVDCHQNDVEVQPRKKNASSCHRVNQDSELLSVTRATEGRSLVAPDQRSRPFLQMSYRARLQAEASVRHSKDPAAVDTVEIPASEVIQELAGAETQLLETRDSQRQKNRTQLQDIMDRLEGLVLIPP
ncbi:tubulin epsilon and delta complex protein 1 isoform X2 [Synchiropus splendidus]|uniref:tubulin epsilon and delta complex protein 1 isoform X2 n=1 Tax=Synchiropus splendidus TaxID=270530 RepID=UPI00237D8DF5|nr:tubulin epsilon and delta complex protein 1 isoform X2 [Synchiropus splendidus]